VRAFARTDLLRSNVTHSFETSAKEAINVEQAFQAACKNALQAEGDVDMCVVGTGISHYKLTRRTALPSTPIRSRSAPTTRCAAESSRYVVD
jgi:hypothetical protein